MNSKLDIITGPGVFGTITYAYGRMAYVQRRLKAYEMENGRTSILAYVYRGVVKHMLNLVDVSQSCTEVVSLTGKAYVVLSVVRMPSKTVIS
jgi:hypothetical protein